MLRLPQHWHRGVEFMSLVLHAPQFGVGPLRTLRLAGTCLVSAESVRPSVWPSACTFPRPASTARGRGLRHGRCCAPVGSADRSWALRPDCPPRITFSCTCVHDAFMGSARFSPQRRARVVVAIAPHYLKAPQPVPQAALIKQHVGLCVGREGCRKTSATTPSS